MTKLNWVHKDFDCSYCHLDDVHYDITLNIINGSREYIDGFVIYGADANIRYIMLVKSSFDDFRNNSGYITPDGFVPYSQMYEGYRPKSSFASIKEACDATERYHKLIFLR